MRNKLTRGFTFIEIMVVVTIMALTFGAIAVSFSSIQVKSRDSRRKADLESIRQALELCRTLTGSYPIMPMGTTPPTSIVCSDGATTYLTNTPVDPKTNSGLHYQVNSSTATSYEIQADIENTADTLDYPVYRVTQP